MRERWIPFVPLDGRVGDKGVELFREGTAGEGDGESALFLDGFLLSLYDEGGEGIRELERRGKGEQHGRARWMVHYQRRWHSGGGGNFSSKNNT